MAAARTDLSLRGWLKLAAVLVSVMGANTAAWGYVFATKAELKSVELNQVEKEGDQKLRDWRIQTLEVTSHNLGARVQKMDTNISSLLIRFRISPAPEPEYAPLPAPPPKEE